MPCPAHCEVRSHFVNSRLAGGREVGIPRHGSHAGHGHAGADLHIADIDGLPLVILEEERFTLSPLQPVTAKMNVNKIAYKFFIKVLLRVRLEMLVGLVPVATLQPAVGGAARAPAARGR